uniref:Pro-opiomelanocortin/corticotropin ACTH central region domain-containing protein n=1 Tax=Esox lucius TaxID=8010 RepID=A0A3P8XIT3_ESOLU
YLTLVYILKTKVVGLLIVHVSYLNPYFSWSSVWQDCIHLCKCGFQVKSSEPRSAVQQPAEKNPTFGILLTALTSGEKALEPTGVIADPDPQSDERHSYSMEHFRWGKPMGRKRRPIKVYISSVEGGNSSKGKSNLKARRQLGSLKGNMENKGAHTQAVLSGAGLQDKKKNITYVIDHFRWGFPYTAKQRRGGKIVDYSWVSRPTLSSMLLISQVQKPGMV